MAFRSSLVVRVSVALAVAGALAGCSLGPKQDDPSPGLTDCPLCNTPTGDSGVGAPADALVPPADSGKTNGDDTGTGGFNDCSGGDASPDACSASDAGVSDSGLSDAPNEDATDAADAADAQEDAGEGDASEVGGDEAGTVAEAGD